MIGSYNTLQVVKRVAFGLYLDGEEMGEILLPNRYVPDNAQIGDYLTVFVYTDGEDRPIATTAEPLAVVGDFAFMQVKSVASVGAFLEWGIMKDLLVPYSEQTVSLRTGQKVLVYVYLDNKTKRVVASAKWERYTEKQDFSELEEGAEVDVLVASETELGYKVLINKRYTGLIYKNEVFSKINIGDSLTAYISKIRLDGKIDVRLKKSGYEAVAGESAKILEKLEKAGGFLPTTDKSPTEEIYEIYGVSKKVYKKAIGELYKKRIIVLESNGIRKA